MPIFRCHICFATLSNTFGRDAIRMIALIDQRITREDVQVEPFIQEIEVCVGEGKVLSEEMKKI